MINAIQEFLFGRDSRAWAWWWLYVAACLIGGFIFQYPAHWLDAVGLVAAGVLISTSVQRLGAKP